VVALPGEGTHVDPLTHRHRSGHIAGLGHAEHLGMGGRARKATGRARKQVQKMRSQLSSGFVFGASCFFLLFSCMHWCRAGAPARGTSYWGHPLSEFSMRRRKYGAQAASAFYASSRSGDIYVYQRFLCQLQLWFFPGRAGAQAAGTPPTF
jgi:hypothetical protein